MDMAHEHHHAPGTPVVGADGAVISGTSRSRGPAARGRGARARPARAGPDRAGPGGRAAGI